MPPRYSAVDWTVSELESEVRLEAAIPDAELTSAQILALASSCIWTEIAELQAVDQAISGSDIEYEDTAASDMEGDDGNLVWVPQSSADTILSVHWYTQASGDGFVALTPKPVSQLDDYVEDGIANTPLYYVVEGGRLRLIPKPGASNPGKVRVYFQAQHPELTVASAIGTLSTWSSPTLTLSATHPTAWPAAPYAVDLYSAYAPHRVYHRGLPISSDSGADLTADVTDLGAELDDLPTDGSVRVALSGQAGHVMLPLVYRRPLTLLVAARILRQQGDTNGANERYGDFGRAMAAARNQIVPRVKGQSHKWVNRDTPLRSRAGRWGRSRG